MEIFRTERIESVGTNLLVDIYYVCPDKKTPYFRGCISKKDSHKRVTVATLKLFPDKYQIISNDVCEEFDFEGISTDDVYSFFTTTCIRALQVAENILTLAEMG